MKIYIYSTDLKSNPAQNNKIQYIFTLTKIFEPIFINSFTNITKEDYVLIFNKLYNPKKTFAQEIEKIINDNKGFTYLSSDKEIYITNNIVNSEGVADIKKKNQFKILFDTKSNKHEHHMIRLTDYSNEYLLLLKNYIKSYPSIFEIDFSYESYKILFNDEIKSSYCLVYRINDIMDIINIAKLKFHNYRIVIAYKNLDYYSEKYLFEHCKNNKYICLHQKNLLDNLKYLWFEKVVFLNKKSVVTDVIMKELDDLHDSFDTVNLDNILSVKGTVLPYYDNINNINCSKTSYPSNDISYELLYTNIIEGRLFKVKGYDKIYEELVAKNSKEPYIINKIVSMAVLCNRPTPCNINVLQLDNQDVQTLYNWFLLFNTAKTKKLVNGTTVDYMPNVKIIGSSIFKKIIDKDTMADNKLIIHFIVGVFDVLIKFAEQPTFESIVNITKYLYKYITRTQTIGMIKMILPLVSRCNNIPLFTTLLELVYPDFTYEKLLEIFPNDTNAGDLLIHITCNFTSNDNLVLDVFEKRTKIKNNLIKLLDEKNLGIYDLERIITLNTGNFYLSYHGVSSRDIFELKSKLIRKLCPELNYKIDTNFVNEKIKVCFMSSFLTRQHSVFKDRHQVIKQMSENPVFEISFITIDDLQDDVKNLFGNAKHIKIERNLPITKSLLENMKLDVIVYCEIAMDPFFYLLAFMKLAKIQINTWGHSDTSGIDTIDYFFSSKLYELPYEEAQEHYTEKLVLLNSLCTCYINPTSRYPNQSFKTRYDMGFNDESIIYFCCQSIFKFNKTYYQYIIDIMSSNSNAVLLMIVNDQIPFFVKSLNNGIINRIHWLPSQQHPQYLNLMKISDAILDPYPFGGCNSILEAFSLGKVVVTQPSQMINGRFTNGFYQKMGLDKYICHNKEEYVDLAIKLGNKEFRENAEKEILNNMSVLFMDKETVTEWTDKITEFVTEFNKNCVA